MRILFSYLLVILAAAYAADLIFLGGFQRGDLSAVVKLIIVCVCLYAGVRFGTRDNSKHGLNLIQRFLVEETKGNSGRTSESLFSDGETTVNNRLEPSFNTTSSGPETEDCQVSPTGALHVDASKWKRVGSTLRRKLRYQGLTGRYSVHHVQLDIEKSKGILPGSVNLHLSLVLWPNPWPDMEEGLLTGNLATGKDLTKHPSVLVRGGPSNDGSFVVAPIDREGTHAMLAAIAECSPMHLSLTRHSGALLDLPIPNDDGFNGISNAFFA